jgi:DHA1 family inner membrane transport protein
MTYADAAPAMASGADMAAFDVGDALGAWLGGPALAAGYGYVSPLWGGGGPALAGLVVVAAGSLGDGSRASVTVSADAAPRTETVEASTR